jgi:L-alanine-DL-glutamate epimerase-like enolase superfamily enzyme
MWANGAVTIQQIRLINYRIPRLSPFVTSMASSDSCYGIFILITAGDEKGHTYTALGDILPRALVTNEITADAWAGARAMADQLKGKQLSGTDQSADLKTVRDWLAALDTIANAQKLTTRNPPPPGKQLRATLCGFDIALLDLLGQVYQVPIYEILGGAKRKEVTLSALTFGADMTPDELEGKVEQTSESFVAIRMKVGLNDNEDVEKLRIAATRLQGKPDVTIWVDVNQAWKTSDRAIGMLARIRDMFKSVGFKATFICEQPTLGTDMPALARTTAEVHKWQPGLAFRMVIAADESIWTLQDAKQIVATNACDMVNIKIQKAGGLLASKDIAEYLATAAPNMMIYIGGVVATDVTSWANLQLCYTLPRLDYVTACVPRRANKVNPASVPVEYEKDKTLKHPTQPGLGTGLDLSKLEGFILRDTAAPATRPAA